MIAILICSLLFASANGELAKQSSDVNYVLANPEANILPPQTVSPVLSAPLNLIKYGPLAGHPIQLLVSNRPNIAYVKPVNAYKHQKDHYPVLPIDLNFELKKYSNHLHSPANELVIGQSNKYAAPSVLIDSSNHHRFDHLKATRSHLNPLLESAGYPHYAPDHHLRNYLPLSSLGHYNHLNHLNRYNHLNPLNHGDSHLNPVHHGAVNHLNPVHHNPVHYSPIHGDSAHGPSHHNPVLHNPVHHSPVHGESVYHNPVHHNPVHYSAGHHNRGFNSHALPLIAEIDNYPSFIKYASPVSTSYFMKINHEVPVPKYHHSVTAKTELPFFDQGASHYGYGPNFIKKKK